MTLRRITRSRRLSPEEATKYREVREQIQEELPALLTRHEERLVTLDPLEDLIQQLKPLAKQRD